MAEAKKTTKATARVQVTLEVELTSVWQDDCQVGQIYRQAAREAVETIEKLFPGRIRLFGAPHVLVVTTEAVRG